MFDVASPKARIELRTKSSERSVVKASCRARYLSSFFRDWQREPPRKADDNKKYFTVFEVPMMELCMNTKRGNKESAFPPCVETKLWTLPSTQTFPKTKTEIIEGITRFADTMRQFFRQNQFLKRNVGTMPSPTVIEQIFQIFDRAVVAYLSQINGMDNLDGLGFLEEINDFKKEKQFQCWLSVLAKWELLSKNSPSNIRDMIAHGDEFHDDSCMQCLSNNPKCHHTCCSTFFDNLTLSRCV